jgi:hypothetical protein
MGLFSRFLGMIRGESASSHNPETPTDTQERTTAHQSGLLKRMRELQQKAGENPSNILQMMSNEEATDPKSDENPQASQIQSLLDSNYVEIARDIPLNFPDIDIQGVPTHQEIQELAETHPEIKQFINNNYELPEATTKIVPYEKQDDPQRKPWESERAYRERLKNENTRIRENIKSKQTSESNPKGVLEKLASSPPKDAQNSNIVNFPQGRERGSSKAA